MEDKWISTAEAAKMLNYSRSYFVEIFCRPEEPLVTIRQRTLAARGGKGNTRRRLLISRASVEALIKTETIHPRSRHD